LLYLDNGIRNLFHAETPGEKTISIGQIATFFSIDTSGVVNHYSRDKAIPKPPGRPHLLPDERFRYIQDTVKEGFRGLRT
jgi:hypothetical protein